MTGQYRVVVTGACGKVGRVVTQAIVKSPELMLVGAVDIVHLGVDIGDVLEIGKKGILVSPNLEKVIKDTSPDVLVDFTNAKAGGEHIKTALKYGVAVVSGTTGFFREQIKEIARMARKLKIGAVIAPNFALGAILMMRFAQEAARWFSKAEIIELHHQEKLDVPSGTALRTARLICQEWEARAVLPKSREKKEERARGHQDLEVPVHSVRLPGLIAHQEVIFGLEGQILTIRHDSFSRESFVPGVMLAIRRVKSLNEAVFGLENLLA